MEDKSEDSLLLSPSDSNVTPNQALQCVDMANSTDGESGESAVCVYVYDMIKFIYRF